MMLSGDEHITKENRYAYVDPSSGGAGRAASALKRPFAPTVVSVRTGVSFKAKCSAGRLTHLGDEQVGAVRYPPPLSPIVLRLEGSAVIPLTVAPAKGCGGRRTPAKG